MHYSKLQVEAILRSALCGLSVGMLANFVLGLIFWFTEIENLPLVIGLLCGTLVLVTAGATVLFYFKKFKPTIKNNATRIDRLGLEERAITMVEYENDDSIIATFQRLDAMKALEGVNEKLLKFEISKKIIASLCISSMLGTTMSVIAPLSAAGLMPGGSELIRDILIEEPPVYISVSYEVEEGGFIDGEIEQLVLLGEDAEEVVAIPDEGYAFDGWDDGHSKPSRHDKAIDHPLVLTAIFVPVDEDGDGESGDEEGEESQEGENGESPSDEGEAQPGENGEPGEEGEPSEDGDKEESGQGSGKYNKVNQIIDGNTYYREVQQEYEELIMELLQKRADELTDEEKAIIEAYIKIV